LNHFSKIALCHSALDAESRVSRENGNPFPLIVPCFRRDSVWIPASAGMTNGFIIFLDTLLNAGRFIKEIEKNQQSITI